MLYKRSSELFVEALKYIPGGVNSPVRAFKSVGGTPIFIKKASGAYLFDEDDKRYIDYINSWGPMILGHAYQPVIDAVIEVPCCHQGRWPTAISQRPDFLLARPHVLPLPRVAAPRLSSPGAA